MKEHFLFPPKVIVKLEFRVFSGKMLSECLSTPSDIRASKVFSWCWWKNVKTNKYTCSQTKGAGFHYQLENMQ